MKTQLKSSIIILITLFNYLPSFADSVTENPSKGVINLPIYKENGKVKISLPKGPPSKKPRTVARCHISNLDVEVIKTNRQFKAEMYENKEGVVSHRTSPYVYSKTLRKEMLGQYQAAVEVAQQLGITEVDYIKIWVVELDQNESKVLIFFYDPDDEIIDRTILVGRNWERCDPELSCQP